MTWSGEQRAFLVGSFIQTGCVAGTIRKFRTQYNIQPKGAVPNYRTILHWVELFKKTGSTLPPKKCNHKSKVRTPENIEKVRKAVQQSPMRSARKQALALEMSSRTVRRILHKDLGFHPYKMIVVQELFDRDFINRSRCSQQILEKVPQNCHFITSDEAHFHLSGFVNKQNYRYWGGHNPNHGVEKPLHSKRVTVWCAVGEFGVWGPYFFEEEGEAVSVNSIRYGKMLK